MRKKSKIVFKCNVLSVISWKARSICIQICDSCELCRIHLFSIRKSIGVRSEDLTDHSLVLSDYSF